MIDPYIAEAQARAAREIDAQSASFDLPGLLTQAWALSAIPLDLDAQVDPALRFGMLPVGLRVGTLSGDDTQLRLRMAVVGRFWIGSRIPFVLAGALPPPIESPAPPFIANLELPLDLPTLQSELHAAMQEVSVGEDRIMITGVELRIVTGGVAVSLQLAGASTANVWALGTLVHEGGALRITGLRWSDETAAAVHDEAFKAMLAQALFAVLSRWQHRVDGALEEIRERSLAGMQTLAGGFDGVTIQAALGDVPASGGIVFGDARELVLRVPTPGQLTITVDAATVAVPQ